MNIQDRIDKLLQREGVSDCTHGEDYYLHISYVETLERILSEVPKLVEAAQLAKEKCGNADLTNLKELQEATAVFYELDDALTAFQKTLDSLEGER